VNVNTKPVEGVVAAYMAKYMSKGRQMVQEAVKDWGQDNCPRQWWNMTKRTRDMVKSGTYSGRQAGQLLDSMLMHAFDTGVGEVYAFLRHVELEFNGAMVTVGWRGRFCEGVDIDLRGMLSSSDI
jgi:hypothetical protein